MAARAAGAEANRAMKPSSHKSRFSQPGTINGKASREAKRKSTESGQGQTRVVGRNYLIATCRFSRTTARRKSPFAGPGNALNRRSRANIGGLQGDQSVFDKMTQKIG